MVMSSYANKRQRTAGWIHRSLYLMMVSLRQYRRHSVPIQYVFTPKNHEGGHPTGDHFATKTPALSDEPLDFSERELLFLGLTMHSFLGFQRSK
jgi:hypothetical protein